MKYLVSLYQKLVTYKIQDSDYIIINSFKCDQIHEVIQYGYANVSEFKKVSYGEFKKFIYSKNSFILYSLQAFISFRLIAEYGSKRLYIYEFHVMKQFQGQSFGTKQLEIIIGVAQFLAIRYIALTVDVDNHKGIQFWKQNKFVIAKESPDNESYIILQRRV
ncbi:Acetyltransferase, GNAT family [Spironucleus salmonicida]|uniref:N-alpha-acetyltransferase 40 n=1 Tax=Spironucleus salmonicida TaxID=348837 RepID=V6LPY9_9EUKA|nr:Acetyltransferase, GNAT family [Spironucleus salmonicida]|eukprot:EST46308.1 Acetyltransferase, GNAT family [Spironucleus salmonicida]